MDETTIRIILAVLGSNALFTFIQFMISRHDAKDDKFKKLGEEITEKFQEREEREIEAIKNHEQYIEILNKTITQLAKNHEEMQQYMYSIGEELTGLTHDTLVRLTDKYQRRGGITLKEKATLNAIYIPYHDGLHGNGDGKTGYEYAMNLPVLSEEEARARDNKIKYDAMLKIAEKEKNNK